MTTIFSLLSAFDRSRRFVGSMSNAGATCHCCDRGEVRLNDRDDHNDQAINTLTGTRHCLSSTRISFILFVAVDVRNALELLIDEPSKSYINAKPTERETCLLDGGAQRSRVRVSLFHQCAIVNLAVDSVLC